MRDHVREHCAGQPYKLRGELAVGYFSLVPLAPDGKVRRIEALIDSAALMQQLAG